MENKTNPAEEAVKDTTPAGETEAKAETAGAEPEEKQKGQELKEARAEAARLKSENEALNANAAALKEQHLRMMAEYDNYRKRTAKEREGIYTDAVADVISGILPIADNLERAAQFGDEPGKVAEGLSLTAKSLAELLAKSGVETFGAPGDTFDPNLHHAIMHEEDEVHGEGEILEVFQKGYRRGERIIRYAMVRVAN